MPGPNPMHPSARQRKNKASTRTVLTILTPDERAEIVVPSLPAGRIWSPQTSDWWEAVWRSPMSLEWDDGDHGAVYALAYLLDDFHELMARPSVEDRPTSRIVALHRQFVIGSRALGLDPMARRSLQWISATAEHAEARTELARAQAEAERGKSQESGQGRKRNPLAGLG